MAKQEITLKGLDGHEDHLVYDAANGQVTDSLEECARSLFPQEGETTPRLRFQGFEGEWNEVTFGEIFKYERPDNYIVKSEEYSDDYPTPVLTANKGFILGYTNENRTFNKECIIFDDFTLDCKHVDFPFMVKSSAMKILTIKDETKFDLYFAYCLLRSTKIEILGHARHYISVVQPTKVLVPSLQEQKQMASFFRRLDKEIAIRKQQYKQLEQIKRACLNTMFPKQNEITPPIRFSGYSGDWDSPMIMDVFDIRNGYTPSKFVSAFWTDGTIPWFRMEDIRDKGGILSDAYQKITPIAVKGAGLFKKNSIIMATTATIGIHAMPIVDSLANQRFTNFSIRKSLENAYDPYFVYYSFFSLDEWAKKNTNTGGLLAVDINGLMKQPFKTPSLEEQKDIASFFRNLDSQIDSEQKRLEQLKQMKSACLRSMFPTNGGGNFKPLVRFNGFEEEWITICFTELFTFLKNNSLSRADLGATGRVKNVHYGDVLIKFGEVIDMNKEELPYITNKAVADSLAENCQLRDGDVVFADAAEDNTVGKCAEIASIGNNVVVSGLHTIPCRPNRTFSEGFLGYCLNANAFHDQLLPLIQGTKISSISKKALAGTYISFPRTMDEQKQIASFFRSLDTKISLQTQRIEKLKQMKAACLSKMIA